MTSTGIPVEVICFLSASRDERFECWAAALTFPVGEGDFAANFRLQRSDLDVSKVKARAQPRQDRDPGVASNQGDADLKPFAACRDLGIKACALARFGEHSRVVR